jgi:hypothetical protein
LYIKILGVYGLQFNGFTATETGIGGLIGSVNNGGMKFENITMVMSLFSTFRVLQVGGLVGEAIFIKSDNQVINSWVKMDAIFSSPSYSSYSSSIGGIAGFGAINIINSHTEGSIFDTNGFAVYVGGLVGLNRRSEKACNPTLGETDSSCGIIASSSSMKLLNHRGWVGGLVGYYDGSQTGSNIIGIHRSSFSGQIEYSNSSGVSYLGGLVGYLYLKNSQTAELKNSYASPEDKGYLIKNNSSTVASSSSYVGGLIGNIDASPATGTVTISGSYSKGTITSEDDAIGGLVGRIIDTNLTISDSYSENIIRNSSVSSESIGGLVGMATAPSGVSLSNNYFAGDILTTIITNVGPLVGKIDPATVYSESNNYFDRDVCNAGTCAVNGAFVANRNGGQGRETAAMQSSSDYATTFPGFDFTTIWSPPLANPTDYPKLRNSPPSDF